MANIFMSHSSKDKEFARKLKKDLIELGHEVWLDEGEIHVGESISLEIQEGINKADYFVLILTPDSIISKWVSLEWDAALQREIKENRTIILPVLLKECEIPLLLQNKLYADFSENYAVGLVKLVKGIANSGFNDENEDDEDIEDQEIYVGFAPSIFRNRYDKFRKF